MESILLSQDYNCGDDFYIQAYFIDYFIENIAIHNLTPNKRFFINCL